MRHLKGRIFYAYWCIKVNEAVQIRFISDYALEIYSNSLASQLSTNEQRKYKLNFGRKGAKAQI
jgi:hypothetical protein